jgi:hypothetical protein
MRSCGCAGDVIWGGGSVRNARLRSGAILFGERAPRTEFTAAGSAGETQHALRQAAAWRLVTARDAEAAMGLVRRIVAILWRMTR